ncbi:MAG: aminotransferase class V-fold PLP-dependent enzyme [Leptolyngbya sp. SIO1D8]|nr:aminotransferase class V-fold PLP-dependent enzyme [Leptolyngbya sp. SIO1D8]
MISGNVTGHKWCCGPAGLGGLYINPAVRDEIAPTFIGWRGITIDRQGNPRGWEPNGKRYEVATSDYPLMAGLQAALKLHEALGTAAERYQRICALSQQLWQQLHAHPRIRMVTATPPASGLVSFQLLHQGEPSPESHIRLVGALETDRYLLRILLHPHCVRACVHYFTLESEVAALGDRILAWLARL